MPHPVSVTPIPDPRQPTSGQNACPSVQPSGCGGNREHTAICDSKGMATIFAHVDVTVERTAFPADE